MPSHLLTLLPSHPLTLLNYHHFKFSYHQVFWDPAVGGDVPRLHALPRQGQPGGDYFQQHSLSPTETAGTAG